MVNLTINMHGNWPKEHKIDHSSIGLNTLVLYFFRTLTSIYFNFCIIIPYNTEHLITTSKLCDATVFVILKYGRNHIGRRQINGRKVKVENAEYVISKLSY